MKPRLQTILSLWLLCIGLPLTLGQDAIPPDRPTPEPSPQHDVLPRHATARFGSLLYRNGQSIQEMAFMDDSTLVTVAGTSSGQHACIQYFEVSTGELKERIEIPGHTTQTVALSKRAQKVATYGHFFDEEKKTNEYSIKVVDLKTKQIQTQPFSATSRVRSMLISEDGQFLFIGGQKLVLWDIAANVSVLDLQVSKSGVSSLAMSLDGKTLAIGYRGEVSLWDWKLAAEPRRLLTLPQQREAMALEFSHDGTKLALCVDGSSGSLQVVDIETTKSTKLQIGGEHPYTRAIVFSPNDKLVTWTNSQRKSIEVHDVKTGKFLHRLKTLASAASTAAFASNSKRMACAFGQTIAICDADSGQFTSAPPGHWSAPQISHVHAGRSDAPLLTYGDDGRLIAWDTNTAQPRLTWRHPSVDRKGAHWIRAAAISPDARWIASSSLDSDVVLWDVAKAHAKYQLPGHGELGGFRALAFTGDNERFASFGDDRYLRLWDVRTGKALEEHRIWPADIPRDDTRGEQPIGIDGPFLLSSCGFSPDAQQLWVAVGKSIYLFDVRSGKQLGQLDIQSAFTPQVAFAADRLYVFDFGLPKQTKLADGRIRYSRSEKARLMEFDIATRKLTREQEMPFQYSGPLTISPDGKWLAMAARHADEPIRILSRKTLKEEATLSGFQGLAVSLQFSGDGSHLYSSMTDTSVIQWRLQDLNLGEDQ